MVEEGSLHLANAREPSPHAQDNAPFPTEPSHSARMAMCGLISAVRVPSRSAGKSSSSVPAVQDAKMVLTSTLPQSFVNPLPDAL
jgi:hypothetical protein